MHISDMIAELECTNHTILGEYIICFDDVAIVYLCQGLYDDFFEEILNLQKIDSDQTSTDGMQFLKKMDNFCFTQSTKSLEVHVFVTRGIVFDTCSLLR